MDQFGAENYWQLAPSGPENQILVLRLIWCGRKVEQKLGLIKRNSSSQKKRKKKKTKIQSLSTLTTPTKSQVKFHRTQNIPGALQENSVAAFLLN